MELKKIILIKDYSIRHDQIVETGSTMLVGEFRASQLADKGFCEFLGDGNEKKRHAKKVKMIKKEESHQIVEHIIKNED